MGKALGAVAALLAGLGLSVPAAAQMATDAGYSSPCQQMTGQVEVDGYVQQVVGLACLQPDGSWQMVEDTGGTVIYSQPAYYLDPWYWAPVGVGFGGSFIFVDRFHHFHHMHHKSFAHVGGGFHGGMRGGFHGGFNGGSHGGFNGGSHGGFNGGSHGGFHGGGGGGHH
jgi:surface antigen